MKEAGGGERMKKILAWGEKGGGGWHFDGSIEIAQYTVLPIA